MLDRLRGLDLAAEAALVGKATVATMAAASVYAFTWVMVMSAPSVSEADLTLATVCVLAGVPLFAGALWLAGARDPWLGGGYVTLLTVLLGVATFYLQGLASLTPTTWMGAAACVAIIYVMDRGNPRVGSPAGTG